MLELLNNSDHVSDDLIDIITDNNQSESARNLACKNLYERHDEWVVRQLHKRINSADDVRDLAQDVWDRVLRPETLSKYYTEKNGKFRSYLRKPIFWVIQEHFKKIPVITNESGEKRSVYFVEITDQLDQNSLDSHILEEAMENIIKPNLRFLGVSTRFVYVADEYNALFQDIPELSEVAMINGLSEREAKKLLVSADGRMLIDCSNDEKSVYIPLRYLSLVDPVKVKERGRGAYLAALLGYANSYYRKRLLVARQHLLALVRESLY